MEQAHKSVDHDRDQSVVRGHRPVRPTPKRRPRKEATVTRLDAGQETTPADTTETQAVGIWAY